MKQARYIKNSKIFPHRYLQFAKVMNKRLEIQEQSIGYTRTQKNFACYLLRNASKLKVMGNIEQVFIDVRRYLKTKS